MKRGYHKLKKHHRRGSTLALAAIFMVLMLGMVSFAVDMGYVMLVRTQLQVAADSAAIAAAAANMNDPQNEVVATASQYAEYHASGGKNVQLNPADVELGVWDFSTRRFTPSAWNSNAVRVTTRRDSTTNGEAVLFFAKVLGVDSVALSTEAVAAFVDNFSGFRPPSSGDNLPIAPFAMDKQTWDAVSANNGTDDWSWNPETGTITAGPDGVVEANLYPQGTGSPGNRGTVDIGGNNNSTADLSRQILDGVSAEDLSYHGGKLELDERGELALGGDPGISTGIKSALERIVGETRIVPIFSEVDGSGDTAVFKIVQFVGVRLVEVDLTGDNKRVMMQPANIVILGGIPASGSGQSSNGIFSPVSLVQ